MKLVGDSTTDIRLWAKACALYETAALLNPAATKQGIYKQLLYWAGQKADKAIDAAQSNQTLISRHTAQQN